METFSALLTICAGNSPGTGAKAQRPVTRSFDVCFHLRVNKRLSKQSWGWWFETPSRPLWRHTNEICIPWNNPNNIHEICEQIIRVRVHMMAWSEKFFILMNWLSFSTLRPKFCHLQYIIHYWLEVRILYKSETQKVNISYITHVFLFIFLFWTRK